MKFSRGIFSGRKKGSECFQSVRRLNGKEKRDSQGFAVVRESHSLYLSDRGIGLILAAGTCFFGQDTHLRLGPVGPSSSRITANGRQRALGSEPRSPPWARVRSTEKGGSVDMGQKTSICWTPPRRCPCSQTSQHVRNPSSCSSLASVVSHLP